MPINASIPNYDPSSSQTNKPFYRRLFSKKQEITLTDAGLVSEKKRASGTDKSGATVGKKAFKVMGEVYNTPPKKGLFDRNKVVISINVEGNKLFAKVNKKAIEKQFDIQRKDFGGKNTPEQNSRLIREQILHRRFEKAFSANDYQELENLAELDSREAAEAVAKKHYQDRGVDIFADMVRLQIDDEQGKKYLERAAVLGSTPAMLALANLSKEKKVRLAWFEAAAFNGSPKGMEKAALYYYSKGMLAQGSTVELNSKKNDLNKALHYLRRYLENAPKGDITSIPYEKMGEIHREFNNIDEAIKCYEKAANLFKIHWSEVGNLYLEKGLNIAREIPGAENLSQDELIILAMNKNKKAVSAFSKAQKAYVKADSTEGKIGFCTIMISYLPFMEKSQREEVKIQLNGVLQPIAEKQISRGIYAEMEKENSEKARVLLDKLAKIKTD